MAGMAKAEVVFSGGGGLRDAQDLTDFINAVCYIQAIGIDKKSGEQVIKKGSGFYAKLDVKDRKYYGVFTNNHVLESRGEAESAVVTFGYMGSNIGKKVKLRPGLIFKANDVLDYSFAGVIQKDVQDLQLGIHPISFESEPEVKTGEQIFVFQHPEGRPKKYSQDEILRIEKPFVFHKADTEKGSSGSPVFTVKGPKLIAIHHSGNEELGYNKGTLCSAILSHLNSDTRIVPPPSPREETKLSRVEEGTPSNEELEYLAKDIVGCWEDLGRRLGFSEAELVAFHKENEEYRKKAYSMLLSWKQGNYPDATYEVLYEALCHSLVNRADLGEKYCCEKTD